ncbi:MAG: FHA domain-containing protein [Limisphaerales bacterium]
MGLFQVLTRTPGEGLRVVEIQRTPFVIGRSPAAGLSLNRPGIFDAHLTVRVAPGEGWVVETGDGALALVEGRPFQRHRLRNGDVIDIGNLPLQFVLAPVRRKSLVAWSVLFWLLIGLIVAAQAIAFSRLVAE